MYSSTGLIRTIFHLPVPNIKQLPTGRREGEVKNVFVEVEQAHQQSAVAETFTPTSVTNFGNHVVINGKSNQTLFNENEVRCMGRYCLELMLRCTFILTLCSSLQHYMKILMVSYL